MEPDVVVVNTAFHHATKLACADHRDSSTLTLRMTVG